MSRSTCVPCSSLESVIEQDKEAYYLALRLVLPTTPQRPATPFDILRVTPAGRNPE